MHGADSPRVLSNPSHWVRPNFEAGTDVELQGDGGLGVFCENLDGALSVDRRKFGLVVVVSGLDAGGLKLVSGSVEFVSDGLPAISCLSVPRVRK